MVLYVVESWCLDHDSEWFGQHELSDRWGDAPLCDGEQGLVGWGSGQVTFRRYAACVLHKSCHHSLVLQWLTDSSQKIPFDCDSLSCAVWILLVGSQARRHRLLLLKQLCRLGPFAGAPARCHHVLTLDQLCRMDPCAVVPARCHHMLKLQQLSRGNPLAEVPARCYYMFKLAKQKCYLLQRLTFHLSVPVYPSKCYIIHHSPLSSQLLCCSVSKHWQHYRPLLLTHPLSCFNEGTAGGDKLPGFLKCQLLEVWWMLCNPMFDYLYTWPVYWWCVLYRAAGYPLLTCPLSRPSEGTARGCWLTCFLTPWLLDVWCLWL